MGLDRNDFALRAARALLTARRATRRIFVITAISLLRLLFIFSPHTESVLQTDGGHTRDHNQIAG
jgi:hypothetical protein